MDVSKMMRWITQKMKTAGLWLKSLPITPHLSRCPYCGPEETTHASRCRQLYWIASKVEGIRDIRLKTIQKWSETLIRKEHEKIVDWENEFIPLHAQQPSPAAQELHDQLRLCEVRLRAELPEPTAEQWRRSSAILEKERKIS